jgi:hypothetical protein
MDLNLKLSPFDGVDSIARIGIFGKLNGDEEVFQKIFLKQYAVVFSLPFLQGLLRGALSPTQT